MKLSLCLGSKIGNGAAGQVYGATVQYDQSSPELHDMALPPLIVKISRRSKANRLAREAYYYEEMECYQGCIIPRYYGLFETSVPPDYDVEPWSEDSSRRRRACLRQHHGLNSPSPNSQEHPNRKSQKSCCCPSPLSILILERVGGRLSNTRNRSKVLQ